jgi:hypothetical protein
MGYQLYRPAAWVLFAQTVLKPGWYVKFFATGTSTPVDVYTTSALSVAHDWPVEADAAGVLPAIYLNSEVVYKTEVYDQDDVLQPEYGADPANDTGLSRSNIGALLYPRTQAEIDAGVTPTNFSYPDVDAMRYGATGDGSVSGGSGTNDAAAFVEANSVGGSILATHGKIFRIGTNTTITSPVHIDGAQISIDSGVTLTLSGPLSVLNTSAPFVGPGVVHYSAASKPGRVVNILPDRSAGVAVRGGGQLCPFGDSYSAGTGATVVTRFTALLASRLNCVENNYAVSGRGVTRATLEAYANLPDYGSRNCVITWMAGFNDEHYIPNNAKTRVKMTDEALAFLANAFLKTATAASAVTLVGTFNNATVGAWAEKAQYLGGTAQYTSTNGDKATYSFSGTSVVAAYFKGSNATYTLANIEVRIDGTLVDTLAPNNTTDGNATGFAENYENLTHAVAMYTDLGSGAHTIEFRHVGTTGSQYMMLDYFGTLSAPGDCPPVLMSEIPFVNAAGYASPEAGRSKTTDALGSAAIKVSADEFIALGYPVAWVPVNDYYDYQANIHTDNDHPGVLGHAQIANAFASYCLPVGYAAAPSCLFTKGSTQSVSTATLTAVTFSAATDDKFGFRDASNTSRIYAPFSGVMRLSGIIVFAGNVALECDAGVYLNGGALTALADTAETRTAVDVVMQVNVSVPVNAGDYAEIKVSHNAAGSVNLQTTCRITAEMVR